MTKRKPELLAPAGNLKKLKTALAFGADAVYFGSPKFSLRVRINEFGLKELKQGIEIVHAAGKKAYVTMNILAHNKHIKAAEAHIKKLKELKPDALFVADPGIISLIKRVWPEVKISLSTQANSTNWMNAQFWKDQGVSRVILARELSLDEIKEIKEKVKGLEIESFVQGALCMAYSGRCFLSKQLKDRDANLGDCVQPCRWKYEIKPIGHDQSFILGEEEHGSYILNSQDLCLLKRAQELFKIKLDAFKIEGRAKSVYYLANVIGAWREAIDTVSAKGTSKEKQKKLDYLYKEIEDKLYHRTYTEGFMFKEGKEAQNLKNENRVSDWEFCGQVISSERQKGKYIIKIKVHNTLLVKDKLELVRPPYRVEKFTLKKMVDSKTKEILDEAHGGGGGQIIEIETDFAAPEYSVLRRKLK